jgi:biopolymer transport protein ExbD
MINIRARGEREDSSDLTSLIDVVFILLIFFILAASFAVHSIDFDLPPAKTSKALAGHVVKQRRIIPLRRHPNQKRRTR